MLYAKETSVVLGSGVKSILHTSCDVPATLNQLKTTVVDGARSIFAPTLVACPDQKHFSKNAPGTIVKGRWGVSMDVEWSAVVELEHP